MFRLRDVLHLPELDWLVDQLITIGPGVALVAGPDPRHRGSTIPGEVLLPSGRSAIFGILFQEIMSAHPSAQAAIIARDKADAPGLRELGRRVQLFLVKPPISYADQIAKAAGYRPDVLVIDRLSPENASVAFEAARQGMQVMSQLDTVLWGAQVAHQLSTMGVSVDLSENLAWVFTVQRMAALCPSCKKPATPDPDQLAGLRNRFPHLEELINEICMGVSPVAGLPAQATGFFRAGGCSRCNNTGRQGDVAAFDLFRAEKSTPHPLGQSSMLSLKESILHLVKHGLVPLDDLLAFETNLLRSTYNLLSASEYARTETNVTLRSKLAELEAGNRVLLKRTEVLIRLQDLNQNMITSTDLSDLALRLCRCTDELCGADRAILYLLHHSEVGGDKAEVLAVNGWDPGVVHSLVDAATIFNPRKGGEPRSYIQWPPGIPPPSSINEGEDKRLILKAGLRVPLIADDHQVGVMIVHSTRKGHFAPGEVALLRTIANQAALAIQRAGLIDDLRAKIVQLEAAQVELVKKERMDRELELARQVQQSVLPRTFPKVTGYAFAARNEPARQVGGDFYDVISLDTNRFGLIIGDVSDKGMPAALYMALTRSLLLAEARRARSPRAVLTNVNRLLHELGEPSKYVSVFYGIVEKATRRLIYARAGHDRPLLLRAGTVQPLGGEGAILGVFRESEFHLMEDQIILAAGDRLVLYTDGLPDMLNPEGMFYGLERLEHRLRSSANLPLGEICESTFADLVAFQGDAEQFDDMTLLVMEVTG